MLFSRDCIWGVTAHPRPVVKWDGDILSFLFACSRFASALNVAWCDQFDSNAILAAALQAGGHAIDCLRHLGGLLAPAPWPFTPKCVTP